MSMKPDILLKPGSESYIPQSYRSKPFYRRLPSWARTLTDRIYQAIPPGIKTLAAYLRPPLWLRFTLVFCVGAGIGIFVMMRRLSASELILTIGASRITAPQLNHRLELVYGSHAISQLVNEEQTLQFARSRHIQPSEAEISTRIDSMFHAPGFAAAVERRHAAYPDIRRQAELLLTTEKLFAANIAITPAEIEAYYRANIDPDQPNARFYQPALMHVREIGTESEAKIRQAQAALSRGEPFASVAKKYSEIPSRLNGGGRIVALAAGRHSTAASLEKRVLALEPGSQFGPEKMLGKWWIVSCIEKTQAHTQTLDEARDACISAIRIRKGQDLNRAAIAAEFEDFRNKKPIRVNWGPFYQDASSQAAHLPIASAR